MIIAFVLTSAARAVLIYEYVRVRSYLNLPVVSSRVLLFVPHLPDVRPTSSSASAHHDRNLGQLEIPSALELEMGCCHILIHVEPAVSHVQGDVQPDAQRSAESELRAKLRADPHAHAPPHVTVPLLPITAAQPLGSSLLPIHIDMFDMLGREDASLLSPAPGTGVSGAQVGPIGSPHESSRYPPGDHTDNGNPYPSYMDMDMDMDTHTAARRFAETNGPHGSGAPVCSEPPTDPSTHPTSNGTTRIGTRPSMALRRVLCTGQELPDVDTLALIDEQDAVEGAGALMG